MYRRGWRTVVAFATIYVVWGATFLAIRIGVREVPPLLFAAMRFFAAGVALSGWMLARGEPLPTRREWASVSVLAALIFVVDYGLLFWAEKRVPSGIAAVMMACTPAMMALAEIWILRARRMTVRLAVALALGVCGVAVLMGRSLGPGSGALREIAIEPRMAAVLLVASLAWSVASALSRKMPMPESKGMSSGAQMLLGGALLVVAAAATGEMRGFHPAAISHAAWWALLYLIVAGSIIGFTAYVWLIHHESPTLVGTYAYVNPVVAVVLGYYFGGEALGLRTVLGILLVLVSVVVITTTGAKKVVQGLAGSRSGYYG